jgi:homoaconitase/3-isopropylmalate dehydratase large subunit
MKRATVVGPENGITLPRCHYCLETHTLHAWCFGYATFLVLNLEVEMVMATQQVQPKPKKMRINVNGVN